VAMALAVLSKHCAIDLSRNDIYAASVGGARLIEPAVDLALVAATASSVTGHATPPGLVAIGEVGLAGEVRPVRHLTERLREAARLGIEHALIPARTSGLNKLDVGLTLHPVADVRSAIVLLGGRLG